MADDAEAHRALQLHWLASIPGYRKAVKMRLSEVATAAEHTAWRIEKGQRALDGRRLSEVLRR